MCSVKGCNNEKIFAKGMCAKHYKQIRKYGKILEYCWNDKTKRIGLSKNYEEAVNMRIEAAKKYYGEYANDEKYINKN